MKTNISAELQYIEDFKSQPRIRRPSPDLNKMFKIDRGRTIYYYESAEKYTAAVERFKEIDRVEAEKSLVARVCRNCRHALADKVNLRCGKEKLVTGYLRVKFERPACKKFDYI